MNRAKKALIRTQKFVSDNKVPIAVAVTSAAAMHVHLKVIQNMNDRLKEMGIYDEFWNTPEI